MPRSKDQLLTQGVTLSQIDCRARYADFYDPRSVPAVPLSGQSKQCPCLSASILHDFLHKPDTADGLLHTTIWEGLVRNCLERGRFLKNTYVGNWMKHLSFMDQSGCASFLSSRLVNQSLDETNLKKSKSNVFHWDSFNSYHQERKQNQQSSFIIINISSVLHGARNSHLLSLSLLSLHFNTTNSFSEVRLPYIYVRKPYCVSVTLSKIYISIVTSVFVS